MSFRHLNDGIFYLVTLRIGLPTCLEAHLASPVGLPHADWLVTDSLASAAWDCVLLVLFLIAMLRFSRLVLFLGAICIVDQFIGTAVIGSAWLDRIDILLRFRNLFMACRLALFHRQWLFI